MSKIYKQYVNETLTQQGALKDISFNIPDDFNFAFDVVDQLATKCPNKVAMKWVSREHEYREFTYLDISLNSNRLANYFTSRGIKKGDKVMLVLKRHFMFWYAIIALHKIGAVAIPATHQLMKKDFIYRFDTAKVKAIVCTTEDNVHKEVELAELECPCLTIKACIKEKVAGWDSIEENMQMMSSTFDRPQGDQKTLSLDPMLMYFTSGTTGYPKIVSHNFSYPLGHIVTAVWWHNVDPEGVHFTIADTGWGKAVWGKLYGQWLAEACVFTYDFDRFNANDILEMFAQYNITSFCAPPTMYRFFIKEDLSKYDLSSLKYTTIAGEALNPEVFKQWYQATGLKLMEGFGQTETTLTVANLIGMEPKPGSMGKPNPQYDVRIVDAENQSVPRGVSGEIVIATTVKPVGLFTEYYLNKAKTDEVWSDGFYHTGDTAWEDEDGYLWYVGRTDDIIKSSGYRIGPFEIESVLMEHKSVLECAVTGEPDPIRGQVIKATIVLANGFVASEELKKDIQNFVKHATAPYKYPRIIDFVEELPKTISGKIRRVAIRQK